MDKTLKVWEVGSGRELRTLDGHTSSVTGVALSRDGRLAVSASGDQTLKVWELGERARAAHPAGHTDLVNGVAVSPDGGRVASAG